MATCFKLFAGLMFVLAAGTVIAAEENAVAVTEARIAELVKQLDNDDFALREAAVAELVEIGPAAAGPVAQAAQGESLEAATRAFTILDKWLSADQLKQAAAREQLAKLAQGIEENSATRRAKALLTRQQTVAVNRSTTRTLPLFAPVPAFEGLRVGVARVEMRAIAEVAGGAGGRAVSISIGDGKRIMSVAEGDFKAQIVEDDKEGIKVTVTTKGKDGKEQKTEYAAKNVEELKEKQPEGFKVYDKYAGKLKQLKIKMDAGAIQLAPAVQAVKKANAAPLTKEAQAALDERVKAREAEVQKVKARVEEIRRQIAERQAKLKEKKAVPQEEQPKPAEEQQKDPLFD